MKTATFPSLRVAPEMRQAAEAVLREGETLSSFVEQSLREQIRLRQEQTAFVARGLVARERASHDNTYVDADDVMKALGARLEKAKARMP